MAVAAHDRNFQFAFRPGFTVDRLHVVRVVTAVTGRVGVRLVFDTWTGVHGFHVAVDLLNNFTQPRVFFCCSALLCLVPKVCVTRHTANLTLDTLTVGRLDYVLVAAYAIPFAVHAVLESLQSDPHKGSCTTASSTNRMTRVMPVFNECITGFFSLFITGRA
jgi:hypothetical protein